MKRSLSKVTRATLILAIFFGLDKVFAFVRQIVIARQFGLSAELDVFNVANNVPDLLFALISGGAMGMAIIPILAEELTKGGRPAAWNLFSKIANLAFMVTAVLAIIIALAAGPIVQSEVGIAPGFTLEQQHLVINLMRINLVATLIFSISGLVMSGLQANQHFLLPAMAPLFYNVGQIFGAVILAPAKGYTLGPITLPGFGMGVYGLVYGVVIGAVLHLAIQIPGLIKYQFHWSPGLGLNTEPVRKVLSLMGPRLITMFSIQLIFIIRDNLASRLEQGAVTSLTYGWMIFQVPETLIGTAIGIALLPTLSEQFSRHDYDGFRESVNKAINVLLALTIPIGVVLSFGLQPLLELAFGFGAQGTELLMWVVRAYMLGLLGQSLVEVATRSFYARQDAILPMGMAVLTLGLYFAFSSQFYRWLGAPGISLSDTLAFSIEAVILLIILSRKLSEPIKIGPSALRAIAAGALSTAVVFGLMTVLANQHALLQSGIAMAAGILVAVPIIFPELKTLFRL
jgi:putative peptidoglycan lipid II flippase